MLKKRVTVTGDYNLVERAFNMKILHINSYYGKSSFYKNLYDIQVVEGLDIDVFVSVSFKFNSNDFDYGRYTLLSKNHNKIDRFLFFLKQNKIYKDLCGNYDVKDYSVTHAHSLYTNGYIAWKLKKEFGIPYIVAVRNTDINVFFKKMVYLRRLGIEILKQADHIVFLSNSYKDEVFDNYVPPRIKDMLLSKTSVIPNGIDSFWLANTGEPKHQSKPDELKLLYVGVINRNKNIITTTKAIELLQRSGIKVKFTLVGRIEDQSIFNRISSMEFVEYIGPKAKEDLLAIYRKSDIFILPSINESFGIVYLEAMSQGLPLIYSKGQGFDGHFNDGIIGYRVNCFDYEEIANRIQKIMEDYSEMSSNCVKNVDKFDWRIINNKYLDLYYKIGKETT